MDEFYTNFKNYIPEIPLGEIRVDLRRRDWYALLLVVLLVIGLDLIWIAKDQNPPHWDMGRHLVTSLDYFRIWTQQGFGEALTKSWFSLYRYYPPLIYLITLPFYLVLGLSLDTALISNFVFITVLAFSTFGIGKELFSREIGFLATLVTLTSPMLAGQFREYQLDAPLTAMVALSLFLLLKTKKFRDYRGSFFFGISVGLGMLTKWTFAGFILPLTGLMVLKVFYNAWRKGLDSEQSLRRLGQLFLNLILVAVPALMIAAPWYLDHLLQLKRDFAGNQQIAAGEGDPTVLSLGSFNWYLRPILNRYLFAPLGVFTMVGIGLSFTSKKLLKKTVWLLTFLLSSYLIFSLTPNKDVRFLFPIIPVMAILAVYWLGLVKNKLLKRLLMLTVIVLSIFGFWTVAFGRGEGYTSAQPVQLSWSFDEILEKVGSGKLYYRGPNDRRFGHWTLRYYVKQYNLIHDQQIELIINPKEMPNSGFELINLKGQPKLIKL